MKDVRLAYDPENEVMFIEMPGSRLDTPADMDAFFDAVLTFWRKRCRGKKVYVVVSYEGFTVNLRENAAYGERMKAAANECAITVLRYGGDPLQRSAARVRSMKHHEPSHLYESREEALAMVRRIRAGEVSLASSA